MSRRRHPAFRDPAAFRRLVAEALDGVPDQFRRHLANVALVVEEEPTDEDIREAGLDPEEDTLYGLYHGVPLPDRPHDYAGAAPDRIAIYRGPLLRDCRDADELRWEIECTVVHEIAHFFGMDDEEIERLGY